MQDRNAPPINPLPPVVWLLAAPMILIELAVNAGAGGLIGGPDAVGWRAQAQQALAFAPDFLRQMVSLNQYPLEGLWRLVSYPFVHVDMTQALFVVVIFLALGKFVGEVFAWWAVLAIFVLASAAGAVAFTLVPGTHTALIGGYPPVYGLIGGYSYILWTRATRTGGNRVQAFRLIGFLLGFQILYSVGTLLWYGSDLGGNWIWVADMAGFATGFLMSFAVSPGGWWMLLARLRQRR